jgi:UrcA family protein
MNFKSIVSIIAFAQVVLLAAPVQAQAIDLDTRAVSYGDLDLSSSEGRKTLDRRLSLAVTQVCGEFSARSSLVNRKVRECREATIADANAQRDFAIAQYRARTPGERELVLRGR